MWPSTSAYSLITFLLIIVMWEETTASNSLAMSIDGMEHLLESEKMLITTMELYAVALEKKLNIIQRSILLMRAENERAYINSEQYLSNSITAFSLLRRLQSDWLHWELFMKMEVGREFIDLISKYRSDLPNEEDIEEAADAIYRLQDTYNLHPDDMAVGKLNGVQYDVTLSAVDCFTIGFRLYEAKQFYPAAVWFNSAANQFKNTELYEIMGFNLVKILQLLAAAYTEQDHYDTALEVLNIAIGHDPTNAELILTKLKTKRENITNPQKYVAVEKHQDRLTYERGCRGEYPSDFSRLYCRYNSTTTHFLILAPLKMEEVKLDPYIVLFHDVVFDSEISILKSIARSKLTRANVYNHKTKESIPAKSRTSKYAWFNDDENEVTLRINERISDMTGFDLRGSEKLQVMNYGMGGHYDTHFDFFNVPMNDSLVMTTGDRIATVILYLSDVEQGGATVFPNIETAVFPRKGSAAMWYNLNVRGEADYKTLHAGCPVLVGSKWICNKWIREKQQIFRRLCV